MQIKTGTLASLTHAGGSSHGKQPAQTNRRASGRNSCCPQVCVDLPDSLPITDIEQQLFGVCFQALIEKILMEPE